MQFSKFSFKAVVLVLVGLASFAAAYDPAPMDIGVDDWNYLSNFKLWGTNGIDTKNRPEFYDSRFYDRKNESDFSGYNGVWPDTLGWVGTAKGDLTTDEVGWFDGPIIVGGAVTVPSGYAESRRAYLLTGPIRTTGGIGSARSRGTVCQGTNKSGACANVPEIRPNLKVPELTGATLSGTLNVSGRTVLNVSQYCSANVICDIYFSSINFSHDCRLVIQMPEGGQPTRIFTNKLNFGTHPEIVVAYQGKGELNQSEYEGNLLIYVNDDVSFDNTDNVPIMGTIVSTGTITLGRNMIFAGQFIANKIKVGNEIKAETFVFKKFNPMIKLSILSEKTKRIKESDTWETIEVGLSDVSTTDVSFSYCFAFNRPEGVHGQYAGHADVGAADASHAFPICGVSKTKVTIPAGKTKADGIAIKPLIDGLVETDEALWFQISDLEGADLTSEYEAGLGYKIYIVSNDEFPTVKNALSFDVNEDEKHTFTKNEFQFQHTTQNFASVIITSLPNKGALYNGTTKLTSVGSGITVAVADLGKLTYQAAANEFGNNYTTFKYKVVGDGVAGGNTSVEYTATVNVIPVNDKPSAADVVFTVNELDHAVSGGPIVVTDVSNERNVDTYTYKLVNVTGSDYVAFNNAFAISKLSNQNATITVKSGALLDYRAKKEYVVYATVSDDAATSSGTGKQTSDQFKITVKIKNENDAPTIENQTFTIAEKNTDGSDWPSGTLVGNVTTASDPDDDPLTYSVVTTGVPFKFDNGSNQLVITDGSVLDYETKPTWTFKVQISDGELTATATVTVNLEDVDEPSPSIVFDYEGDVLVNGNVSTGDAIDNFTLNNSKEIQDQLSEIVSDLSYTLASNTSANVTDYFNIDTESGDITAKTELIFEALYPNYAFTIGIDATGKNVSDEPVSVNISKKIVIKDVNEAPVITNEEPLVVSQSALNNGGIVGKVEAVDPDSCSYNPLYVCANGSHPYGFNKLKYSIKEVIEVDGSIDFPFEIDSNTGVISVKKGPSLVKRYNYDYTSVVRKVASPSTKQKQYQFIVEVTDSSSDSDNESKSVQKLMSIDVTEDNTAPVFESVSSEYVVSENTAVGETIGEAILVFDEDDADVNGLTVSIADKDECDIEKNCAQTLFEVVQDGETNEETHISKFVFKVKKDLNYEALYKGTEGKAVFYATLSVADGGAHSVTRNVVIHVNDINEKPYFTNSTDVIEIAEKTTVSLNGVTFEDEDKFANNNNELVIVGGDSYLFEIASDGLIKLKEGFVLDYNNQNVYVIKVRVRDAGVDVHGDLLNPNLYEDKTFNIVVINVNEPPVFLVENPTFTVKEHASNAEVGVVSAVDDDCKNDNACAALTYSLAASVGNPDDYLSFAIDENTGAIKVNGILDYEIKSSYKFEVAVTDGEFMARVPVTVNVIDVNEKPILVELTKTLAFPENQPKGYEIGVLTFDELDTIAKFRNNMLECLNCRRLGFNLDENTGVLTTTKRFDYETDASTYKLNVVVYDASGDESLTDSGTVYVELLNVDNPAIGDSSMVLSAVFFDWAGESYHDSIDIDFGHTHGGNSYTKVGPDSTCNTGDVITGMVQQTLVNGRPAREEFSKYPWDKCAAGHEIDKWFVPQVIANVGGKEYTNSTKKNIKLQLDEEGDWYANYMNESGDCNDPVNPGFFPLDDFEYLDSAKTIKNPKFDWNVEGYVNHGDGWKLDTCKHNYSYSMMVSASFKYVKGQYFEFLGDDDVWVFINNKLVVDIGGIHEKVEGAVDLDTLNLTEGREYPFHIFYAERNATGSNLAMRTSITFIEGNSSSSVAKSSSSSRRSTSSSSSRPASSSSKKNQVSSSSNSVKPASSSSSVFVASSSSQFVIEPESSASSSDSNTSEYAYPTFHVRMVAPFEFEIVMLESLPSLARQYAVMDMKGQVLSMGELNSKETRVKVPTRGAYVVRVGLGYKRVNVK